MEEVDRISLLPDCLLLEILSRLDSTQDAIRTGSLSKRWQKVWPYLHVLKFSRSMMTRSYSNKNFYSFIDKTLSQCCQLNLRKFQLYTTYDIKYEWTFNNWIRYATSCNVQELNFSLPDENFCSEFVVHGSFFTNSCFTKLELEGFIFKPPGSVSWKNLQNLRISNTEVLEDLIQKVLSGCPLLETFKLGHCYGFRRLDVTSKSVKNLVLSGYSYYSPSDNDFYFASADVLEINAPNILSLVIDSKLDLVKVVLLNVSSLVVADLDYWKPKYYYETTYEEVEQEIFKGILLRLHHVEEVKIGKSCSKVVSRLEAEGFIFPSNMKCLEWSDSD